MKIQNDAANAARPISADTKPAPAARKERPADQAASAGEPLSDAAEISAVAEQSQSDPARLERLREAVRNGTYSVPAHEVSARIIDAHLNDLNKRS
jgi:anti-sigma28 factor (negative regulator of flagellin synthesis)